jgi:hypothetical protein
MNSPFIASLEGTSEIHKKDCKYPFKKPGEISEVCVEQENALDSNFGNFLPQNIEMILKIPEIIQAYEMKDEKRLFQLGHSLKDMSANFNTKRMENLTLALETQSQAGQWAEIP